MPETVVDASALLALLNGEPGADMVAGAIPGGIMSAVNVSEVVAKLADARIPETVIRRMLRQLGLEIIPFDESQAYQAGMLRTSIKEAGLSSGDRACLGLARLLDLPVLTADRAWAALSDSLGVQVRVIR